jgi:hypothetical protein
VGVLAERSGTELAFLVGGGTALALALFGATMRARGITKAPPKIEPLTADEAASLEDQLPLMVSGTVGAK